MHPALRRLTAFAGAVLAGTAAALLLASPASAHDSGVSGTFACDSATGEWVVEWTARSANAPADAKQFMLIETGGLQWTPEAGTFQDVDKTFVSKQRLPADAKAAAIAVKAKWSNGFVESEPSRGKVAFTGTCDRKAPAPKATFASACDNTVTVTLDNTAGTAPAQFTVTGKDGWVTKKTVEAGKTDTVKVPAANSQKVTVTEGEANTPVATGERAVPANCGGLPVTGAKAGAAAAGALSLVGAGLALFVVARRRRIRFTT